jgi:hypothetical protein
MPARSAFLLCPFYTLLLADVVERQVLLLHPSLQNAPASSTETAGEAAKQGCP